MKILEFGQDTSLSQVLESIKAAEEEACEIRLPEDSLLFSNPVNKEIIEKFSKKLGKQVLVQGSTVPKKGETEDFGFVEGQDIVTKRTEAQTKEDLPAERKDLKLEGLKKATRGPFKFISNLKGRKKLLFYGSGALILAILIIGTSWFLPSAEVKVIVESEIKTNQITLSASEEASSVDIDNKVIPLSIEEVNKSDVATGKTTGKLVIGSPAKGRVTIGNFSLVTSKKYQAGTAIKTVSGQNTGLGFTLDTQVTVPKATSSGFSIVAGQAGVNVTAKKIGTSGNVPAGTEFQVASEDIGTVKAVNDLAFTGGESKEVSAVSEEDRKKLKKELLEKLSKEAEEELEGKLEGATVPEGGLKTEIIKETYDKVVGEEAKEITLTLEVKAAAKLFQEDDLKRVLIESINPSVPEGFIVDEENSKVTAEIFENEGDKKQVDILGKIEAVLIPDIKAEEIKKDLSGKSFGAASSYLQSLNNISGFEIEIRPAIFRLFKLMPFNNSRINVNIFNPGNDSDSILENNKELPDEKQNAE